LGASHEADLIISFRPVPPYLSDGFRQSGRVTAQCRCGRALNPTQLQRYPW
jgi:hypothetical protein